MSGPSSVPHSKGSYNGQVNVAVRGMLEYQMAISLLGYNSMKTNNIKSETLLSTIFLLLENFVVP